MQSNAIFESNATHDYNLFDPDYYMGQPQENDYGDVTEDNGDNRENNIRKLSNRTVKKYRNNSKAKPKLSVIGVAAIIVWALAFLLLLNCGRMASDNINIKRNIDEVNTQISINKCVENQLKIKYQKKTSLTVIEKKAKEMGMVKLSPEQTTYIDSGK